MKMCEWTPPCISYMEDASARSTYFEELAALVRGGITREGYLCDAGCGMGQMSIELSSYVRRIDAIDRAPAAIDYLKRKIEALGIENVRPHLADLSVSQPGELYDEMLFCLSLAPERAWRVARAQCRGKAIVINKIQSKMETPKERPVVHSVDQSLSILAEEGVFCEASECSLDFNQPFRSIEDARLFFDMFRTRDYPNGVSREELMRLLESRDDEAFPYCLPVQRHLAIFSIDIAACPAC